MIPSHARVVADTNIFISALFWKGTPERALNTFRSRRAILVLSNDILSKLEQKLASAKFAARMAAIRQTPEEVVQPLPVPNGIVRDDKDQMILACALGGRADAIISGDKDLTNLKQFSGIPILTAATFLEQLNTADATGDITQPHE